MIDLKIFLAFLLFINLLSFSIVGYDKYLAKALKWRISENMLLFLSLIFGAIGTYLGMYKFKHKTKKVKFTLGIPLILIINIISIYLLFKYNIIEIS